MKEQKQKPPFDGGAEKTKPSGKRRSKKLAIKARKEIEMKKKAAGEAKDYMDSKLGREKKEEPAASLKENKEEDKNENSNNPYPQLFIKKERPLNDAFSKKEELVYQELLRRFLNK